MVGYSETARISAPSALISSEPTLRGALQIPQNLWPMKFHFYEHVLLRLSAAESVEQAGAVIIAL